MCIGRGTSEKNGEAEKNIRDEVVIGRVAGVISGYACTPKMAGN